MSKNLIIMSRVRKIIELFHSSTGKKTIGRRLNLPLNTVRRYIWLFLACEKSYEELMAMNDTELERMFIQRVFLKLLND
jgi:hypothetical protein